MEDSVSEGWAGAVTGAPSARNAGGITTRPPAQYNRSRGQHAFGAFQHEVAERLDHRPRRTLTATGLGEAFERLTGGDSLPRKKPDGAVLTQLLAEFGVVAQHAAHVGDSLTDMEAAHNAGVSAWAVPWGYNAGRPIADAHPVKIFQHLSDIADHVLALRALGLHRARSATRE